MHSKTVSGVLLRLALFKPEEFLSEISHTYTNSRQRHSFFFVDPEQTRGVLPFVLL